MDPTFSRVVTDVAEAMSIKFNTMVYELRQQGKKVVVLSLGEAFFDIPLFSFEDLPMPGLYHYSHSRGIPELRKKLSGYFLENYGVRVDPESEILVTAGSKAAIFMALLSIVDPGDEVLILEPAWVSYSEQVKLCYGKPVCLPYDYPLDRISEALTDKTKAIVFNNPHNPSGYVFKREELAGVLAVARKKNVWLLSDEAYSDFVLDGSFISFGKLDPEKRNTILFNSISKNFGISGWRIGYLIARSDLINQVLKVNQHLITCPATILEQYVDRHFDRILEVTQPQIRDVVQKRAEVARFMDGIGLEYREGTGTFYFFVSIRPSKLGSEEFCERLLRENHVCVVPGVGYGRSCDGFVRVSVGTAPMEEIHQGLGKLKELIGRSS